MNINNSRALFLAKELVRDIPLEDGINEMLFRESVMTLIFYDVNVVNN